MSTIKLKRSGTTGSVPSAADLVQGELSINYADNKLFALSHDNVTVVDLLEISEREGVSTFNGLSGDVDVSNSLLQVGGISAGSGATFAGLVKLIGGLSADAGATFTGLVNFKGEGISADAGATFGGSVYLPTQYASIGPVGGQIQFNEPGNQIVLHEEVVDILQTLRHYGDTDTYLKYTTDDVTLRAGGNVFLHGASTYSEFGGVTFASGGATFAEVTVLGGITASGRLYAEEGVTFGGDIQIDGNHHIRNAAGNSVIDFEANTNMKLGDVDSVGNDTTVHIRDSHSSILMNAAGAVTLGTPSVFIDEALKHTSDTNTKLSFDTDDVTLHAGGNEFLHGTSTYVNVGGVTFAGGTANFGGSIVLENDDYISNPSDYTVRMMPEGTSATDYGLEFEFSDWGYGSVITNRRASDLANAGSIRFDTPVVINNDKDLTMGGNAHSRMRFSTTGNNTLQIGVRASDDIDDCSGALALIHSGHMGVANRSPGVTYTNPNLYVYSYSSGADKYIRFEHDGTDANIVTGAGDISLQPAGGIACGDNEVSRPKFKDYSETALATSSKSASFNVDFESGNVQSFTFADDLTVSFTNPPASGAAGTVTLIITNGGANTTTWHSSVKWPGDNAPALTASGVDVISFMTIDAGTTIYGFVGGINFS